MSPIIIPLLPLGIDVIDPDSTTANILFSYYDNVKFKFRPTSNHFDPLYLNVNKSPFEAVVVNVGAVSSLNSYAALNVTVLDPVPSCIISKLINAPAIPPESEHLKFYLHLMLLLRHCVIAFQDIVEVRLLKLLLH